MPAEEEMARYQRVRPIMNEVLRGSGLVSVAEDKVYVTGLNGPLEKGRQEKVRTFADRIAVTSAEPGKEPVSEQRHASAA
jgi:hypothetical protein